MSCTLKFENCKEERECSVDASVCVGMSVYGEVAVYACLYVSRTAAREPC